MHFSLDHAEIDLRRLWELFACIHASTHGLARSLQANKLSDMTEEKSEKATLEKLSL